MLSAWLERGIITRAVVVEQFADELRQQFAAHAAQLEIYADLGSLPNDIYPDLVVLAVKPQQMTEVLTTLAPRLAPAIPILTIAAGLRIDYYVRHLPHNPIIRVMPNTPVMVGRGMTVGVAPSHLSTATRAQVEQLLTATGDFFWLGSEDELDAAMAISGSGPAYFFYLAEALAKAGIANGLTPEQSTRLARQTLGGAGAMVDTRADVAMPQLRKDVTSPGGVTEAAIKVWDAGDVLLDLIRAGVDANIRRAQELAKGQ